MSVTDPRGPAAAVLEQLWWVLLLAGTVVALVTFALLAIALLRGSSPPDRPRTERGLRFVLVWGAALPAMILVGLMVLTFVTGGSTYRFPFEDLGGDEPLRVEVTGHQFWWEVRYPDAMAVTANEMHIPAGRPVELLLRSEDVIHSFWVPQLAGKIDLIPGRENTTWLQADEPGVYRGICAEYCGIQHARMSLRVVAQEPDAFAAWLEAQAADAAPPRTADARQGRDVYLGSSCIHCHRIRGLNDPPEDVGPDLTHLASRLAIGAGILENNRGNLAGWIMDPQAHKPGVRMPATDLTGPQLQALLAYLEGLE